MSKPRISDGDRTALMVDLVRRRHEPEYVRDIAMGPHTVVLQEVAQSTGFSASRWADVLALGIWRRTGERLDGYEIKASRADLKRELADPTKHRATARYCDTWTLVLWDESMIQPGIPESWGILLTADRGDGERELVVRRRPQRLNAEPWPRGFVASLVRNAYQQSPASAFVGRAAVTAYQAGLLVGERAAAERYDKDLEPLAKRLYGHLSKFEWDWKRQAGGNALKPSALAARAVEELRQYELLGVAEESRG